MESNSELLARHKHVAQLVADNRRQLERMTLGSPSRMRKAQFGGSLTFTLLQIESDMRERGLAD